MAIKLVAIAVLAIALLAIALLAIAGDLIILPALLPIKFK
jgi:hypothetical protein